MPVGARHSSSLKHFEEYVIRPTGGSAKRKGNVDIGPKTNRLHGLPQLYDVWDSDEQTVDAGHKDTEDLLQNELQWIWVKQRMLGLEFACSKWRKN